ncbi:MAG: DUF4105 domain-containing protein [Epsilonproteobacteria bacterium]|nr:DUF4105 domain-containing protein [Campylobacterota bacterium]
MLDRGVTLVCLYLLLPSTLFTSELFSTILHHDRYWHTLLHYKNGESEIDDPNFFLDPLGKRDPQAELNATIQALLEAKDQSIVCRFPARAKWLSEKLPHFDRLLKYKRCDTLEETIIAYSPHFMTLVFPTAHINSPASMYGHTFLRVDSDQNTPLISNAINYAAHTDESNGFLYAYHGLTGGYEGRYSILPYYDKIKEYNDMERRDIWEYALDLNATEIKKLLYHYYEIKESYADYYFFNENCSYALLWLLESAREGLHLTDNFEFKVIPIDTVRLLASKGLIKKRLFRASKSKRIEMIASKIEDMPKAKRFLKTHDKHLITSLKEEQKAYVVDLSTEVLRYDRVKNRVDKKAYVIALMKLLHIRSQIDTQVDYQVTEPSAPLSGHQTSRITVEVDEKGSLLFGIKPSFHDIYDLDNGYSQGAYINFFDLALQKRRSDEIKLEKFDIVNILSYAPRTLFFKPLSWSISTGWQRDYLDNLQFYLKGGIGQSYRLKNLLYYFFIHPSFYYDSTVLAGVTPKLGLLYSQRSFKVGASVEEEFLTNGQNLYQGELFSTIKVHENIVLNLKYVITRSKKRDQDLGSLALFYYF